METEKQFQVIQQFRFQEQFQAVRSMVDQAGEPWFIAKDVCDVLEHSNTSKAVLSLDDDEKGVTKGYTLGGDQDMIIINESGLYNLIFRSNKPQAKVFRKWVTSEVLPAIRKQGHYGCSQKIEIPADPAQAWAVCAYLTKQERLLVAQLRNIRKGKRDCMLHHQAVSPPFIIPDTLQVGLFPQ